MNLMFPNPVAGLRKFKLEMTQVGTFLALMIFRIVAHILMILKRTTMTTDIVIRYAEDINHENEIANFQRYTIRGNSISAVSWELPGIPRRKGGEYLLKKMTERILLGSKAAMLHVMVELSATQPDNAIVN